MAKKVKKAVKKVTKAKRKAKATKRAPKVELVEHFVTILLGLKNNRSQDFEDLMNMGYTLKNEVASRAGVYATFSKMVPLNQ